MAHSKITLIGMYQYLDHESDDLFSEIVLPTGINKQIFIDSLMLHGAEFEVLYSDPQTMKYAIGAWSKKWANTLKKWADALAIEYNPLENYDRNESWSDAKVSNNKQKGSSSDASVMNSDSENQGNRAGYDSASYSPVDQNIVNSKNSSSSASMTQAEGSNDESAHQRKSHR